jgi:hypothetical protein
MNYSQSPIHFRHEFTNHMSTAPLACFMNNPGAATLSAMGLPRNTRTSKGKNADILKSTTSCRSLGSSVSTVSGHGLENRTIEVRPSAEERGFVLLPLCPDRLWGPPSLLSNGHRGSFLRVLSAAGA